MAIANKEKIRKIYEALPKLNCGLCGYRNCGQFARAVVEGKASSFGCQQNPWAGYKISEIIRTKVPTYGYQYGFHQPVSAQRPEPPSPALLRKEVGGLFQRVDELLTRIEKLESK